MSVLESMRITDPLPQRYLTQTPGVGGRIKVRPEDFLVYEIPLYEPDGKGEHLYLGIQKTNVSHGEMMSCLRRQFGVREFAIGYAGMKDKAGVTRQTVSIHLPKDPPSVEIDHKRIQVLWSTRHLNKIRMGHLAGNRFSIRIREVDPMKAPAAMKTLRQLEQDGVPNYFGSQRFGYRGNNHRVGAALLAEDWTSLTGELLGTVGGVFPEYQRERREAFDAGRLRVAASLWTTADRAERIACERLAAGHAPREAVLAVGGTALSFWISSLQSAIFNRVLDQRLETQSLATLAEGDLAWKHDNRAVFTVTAADLAGGQLTARLAAMEISPSGPMWGKGMLQAGGAVAIAEREALEAAGLQLSQIMESHHGPEGARRPLRFPVNNTQLESGLDEHGPFIRVAFDLPRGSYATIVLREIMKSQGYETDESSAS